MKRDDVRAGGRTKRPRERERNTHSKFTHPLQRKYAERAHTIHLFPFEDGAQHSHLVGMFDKELPFHSYGDLCNAKGTGMCTIERDILNYHVELNKFYNFNNTIFLYVRNRVALRQKRTLKIFITEEHQTRQITLSHPCNSTTVTLLPMLTKE